MLQIILVNHVEEYIVTKENKFAYKKGHSTDMCILTFKECIRYHTVHNTPMYIWFVDASVTAHWPVGWTILVSGYTKTGAVVVIVLSCVI